MAKRYYRATSRRTNRTMGKPFRTKKGKYGCYVYVNGKRVGFQEMSGSQSDAWHRANYRRG